MAIIVENTAKGLFAEAERFEHGNDRSILTLLAARIALHHGLIRKHDDYGDLADVETFLRDSGSAMHLLAIPRTADMMGDLPPADYSWMHTEHARQAGEPNYFAIVADGAARADFAQGRQGISPSENLRRLGYTGMPQLGNTQVFEKHLLSFVPPLVQ